MARRPSVWNNSYFVQKFRTDPNLAFIKVMQHDKNVRQNIKLKKHLFKKSSYRVKKSKNIKVKHLKSKLLWNKKKSKSNANIESETYLFSNHKKNKFQRKLPQLDFNPGSYLPSPHWLSSIMAHISRSPSLGAQVHLPSSSSLFKQSKKQQHLQFSSQQRCRRKKKKISPAEQHALQLLNKMNTF